jgi:hypothetical protein
LSSSINNTMMPYEGCPSLAWFIAKRVTDTIVELDCTIMIVGKKGAGKSILSLGLAYEISRCIAIIKNRVILRGLKGKAYIDKVNELSSKYFNMNHVKSVDKEGTMEMFSGDIIKTENAVLMCDDVSIAANSRNSMTQQNKALSQIMTVSRPYRNTLILNTVYSTLVDKTARNFSDIVIEVLGVDKKNKRSIAKVYIYSVNQSTGKEYRKFFRWHNKRIKYWVSYLPPKHLITAYKNLRLQKTKELLDSFNDDRIERNEVGTKRDKNAQNIFDMYKDEVIERYDNGESIKSISRISEDLSEYWVNKIIGRYKKEQRIEARK